MTWEQKLQALSALTPTQLRMRAPGDWYVEAKGRAVKDGNLLKGHYGNGKTPQEAVENDWLQMEAIPSDQYIVVSRNGERSAYRWNGFMWETVNEQ